PASFARAAAVPLAAAERGPAAFEPAGDDRGADRQHAPRGRRGRGRGGPGGMLQADGLIQYHRGAITVLDRPKLEQRACECYAVVKREFERLLHLPGRAEALPLSGFISQNMDAIVAEWETFARTL